MGWSHIPDMDTAASTSDYNLFAGPKAQAGTVSVTMTTDEWLCSKMGILNITLTEGYPSRSSEAGGLLKDQFVRPPPPPPPPGLRQNGTTLHHTNNTGQDSGKAVSSWSTDASKVNSTYSRIAKAAGIALTPPAVRSHRII